MELLRVQNAERDKDREEREKDRQLEFEKMKINERRRDNDRVLERERLRLVDEGKLQEDRTGDSSRSSRGGGIETLSSMVRFLPKFNDRDFTVRRHCRGAGLERLRAYPVAPYCSCWEYAGCVCCPVGDRPKELPTGKRSSVEGL